MEYLFISGGVLVFIIVATVLERRRIKRISMKRGDANICAFARSLDYRNLDTKIIRAVYNEFKDWNSYSNVKHFPVQTDDDIYEIYRMDDEDLWDIFCKIADRVGRSIEDIEQNPWYGKVKTVEDLIFFLNNQPKKIDR
jgi:hypothetical protein